jgi:hypothetical protein
MGKPQPKARLPVPSRPLPIRAALVVTLVVLGCSMYANLSFAVTDPAAYRFFPPFKPFENANLNRLGGEYFEIAKSIAAGDGFSSPFKEPTGPTAWMPPVLPLLLAGLLWVCDGNPDAVAAVVVFLQLCVLIGTGLLVLALARQTTRRVGAGGAAAVFILGLLGHFPLYFQQIHDGWLVLLAIDVFIAGFWWWQPLERRLRAAAWGLVGGLCALINPIVGLTWAVLSLVLAGRQRAWSGVVLPLLVAGLTLAPWTLRNYLVFGRLIPVKSNLAYELYQSQCRQPDGLIQRTTFGSHPHMTAGRERQEYQDRGEVAFLDQIRQRFWQAVSANPLDFLKRVVDRFLGATLWYVPLDRTDGAMRPWHLWFNRLLHPLPFLGLLVLLCTDGRRPLLWGQRVVLGIYGLYLLPYIGISYYERYGGPLLGVKVLLVLWAVDRLLSLRKDAEVDQPENANGPCVNYGLTCRS